MRCLECFFENRPGARRCRGCGATLPNDREPALSETFAGQRAHHRGGFFSFGTLTLLGIGNILWRVLCELVMLVFRIHEALMDLDDKARALIGLLVKESE